MTVKPYFAAKYLLIGVAVVLFVTVSTGNLITGFSAGIMLGMISVSYPFAVGEKGNMDALYATLAVDRKTVVFGRYLFALAINVCCVVFACALAAAGIFAAKFVGFEMSSDEPVQALIAISVIFVLLQLVQLPMYFKLSYTKAKWITAIPFIAIMAVFMLVNMASKAIGLQGIAQLAEFAADNKIIIVVAALAALCLAVFASLRLSLAFYRKREF
jgi:hypothetical protein